MGEQTVPALSKEAMRIEASIEEYVSLFGKIESSVPGRVRLRLNREYRSPDKMEMIRERLARQPGVEEVTVNQRTGSILVQYDFEIHPDQTVLKVLKDLAFISEGFVEVEGEEDLFSEGEAENRSSGQKIADAVYDVDLRIYEKTGLRFHGYIIPAGIAGLGVIQLAVYGLALETMSGPLLLYIAWDVYRHLNAEPPLPPAELVDSMSVPDAADMSVPAAV